MNHYVIVHKLRSEQGKSSKQAKRLSRWFQVAFGEVRVYTDSEPGPFSAAWLASGPTQPLALSKNSLRFARIWPLQVLTSDAQTLTCEPCRYMIVNTLSTSTYACAGIGQL